MRSAFTPAIPAICKGPSPSKIRSDSADRLLTRKAGRYRPNIFFSDSAVSGASDIREGYQKLKTASLIGANSRN